MINRAYSIFDTKTGSFSPPFFVVYHAEALRAARSLALDSGSIPGQYAEDFALMFIGEFDTNLGQLLPSVPENLGLLSSLIARKGPEL